MSSKRGKQPEILPIEKRLELLETQHDILRKSNQELQWRLDQAMKWIHNEGWHFDTRFQGCVGQKRHKGRLITFDLRKISRLIPVNRFNTLPKVLLQYILSFLKWPDHDNLKLALDPVYMSIPFTHVEQCATTVDPEDDLEEEMLVVKNTVYGYRGEIWGDCCISGSRFIWMYVDLPLSWQRVLHV